MDVSSTLAAAICAGGALINGHRREPVRHSRSIITSPQKLIAEQN
jgi:hypothetical protein